MPQASLTSAFGCGRLQSGVFGGADEVGEEAVGAGDAFGELAVEGEAEVDPGAAAGAGDEQAAELRLLAGVVGFEQRRCSGGPRWP